MTPPSSRARELACYSRSLSELHPIEDLPMTPTYPAAQARVHTSLLCRTPIEPVTRIEGVVFKGNTDINPTGWNPPQYRECLECMGKGVGRALPTGGNQACPRCLGYGRVKA